jgi:hypothetical protein
VACLTFVVAANHHGPTGGGPAGRMLLAGRSALLRSVRPERTDMLDMRVIFVGHLAGNTLVVHEERKAPACLLSACV